MSDNDSDNQHHQPQTKLSLSQLNQQSANDNLFNFRQRSHHSSSSSDQENQIQNNQIIINKQIKDNKNQEQRKQQQISKKLEQKQKQKQSLQKLGQVIKNSTQNKELAQDKVIIQKIVDKQQVKQSAQKKQQKQETPVKNDTVKTQQIKNVEQNIIQSQQKKVQKPVIQKVNQPTVHNKQIKQQPQKSNDKLTSFKQQISQFFSIGQKKQPVPIQKKPQQKPKPQKINVQVKSNKTTQNNTQKQSSVLISFQQPVKMQLKTNAQIDNKKQAEIKYQKQMQDDLANLKKNLIKKKKNSDKQPEKNKVNKTVIPSLSKQLQFDQTPQTRAMEVKMITSMAQQKKKQNYHRLKEWDKRRAESLAIHRNMIQILQSQIDKRIKSSIQNLEIYTTFFRQKAKQQQKYAVHPVINTKYALQNNNISKNVYINCTVILNALSDENNARCKKIQDFVQLIRNDILRDSIEAHLSQSQRQLLKVRQKISAFKAALRRCNTETEQKTNQLALFFNENSVSMNIDSEKDFFSTQLQFLSKAQQQTLIQKKLGQHCLQYFFTAMSQQLKRSIVIRDAMVTFSKALQQCYGIQTDPAQIQQLSKAQQNKLIQQFYSLEQIFDQRCLTVFKNYEHIQSSKTLNVDIFSSFLNRFDFQGFDSRIILLKQFHTNFHSTSKTMPNPIQTCYLVITVDKWIHLFFDKQKTAVYTKPDVSIKATLKNLELKPYKNEIVDMVIKEQKRNSMISYFWETKNQRTYRVQFKKKDNREQFIDYVRKLRG